MQSIPLYMHILYKIEVTKEIWKILRLFSIVFANCPLPHELNSCASGTHLSRECIMFFLPFFSWFFFIFFILVACFFFHEIKTLTIKINLNSIFYVFYNWLVGFEMVSRSVPFLCINFTIYILYLLYLSNIARGCSKSLIWSSG